MASRKRRPAAHKASRPVVRKVALGGPAPQAPKEAPPKADVPLLVQLERLERRRRRIEDQEVELVGRIRDEGTSWHQIALVLGITAEGARRRYAG